MTVPRDAASANAILSALLEARTGQLLGPDRLWRIETALRPLLRERGNASIDQLVMALLAGGEPLLGDRIVEALLNHETSFFRDPAVLTGVIDTLLPAIRQGRRLRIWSAGCSTGQEPLSLAIALAEGAEDADQPAPEIVASDVSEAAIARARHGRFTQFEIQRGLSTRQMLRWFAPGSDGDWIADPALMRRINYRRVNLVRMPWTMGSFDVILCRNVLLYLVPGAKAAVFEALAAALRPGGLLVLGAGETVLGQTAAFQPSRHLRGAYEVTPRASAAA